jgi:hypothetical protein
MSYTTVRSGFTGPSNKIGGSTAYHQDLKLLQSLPAAEKVKMLDAIARQNASIGREIEFSNAAVSGRRWNVNADLADKIDLLQKAAAAHGHSQHGVWQSFDYYTPFKGKNRFEKGAVEDASIFLPAVPGGTIRRGSGGGYGYYSESLDPSGRMVARVGHGNIDRPEKEGNISVGQASPEPPAQQTQQPGEQAVVSLLKELFGQEKKQPTLREALMSSALQQALQRRDSNLLSQNTLLSPTQFLMDPQKAMSLFE